MKHPWQVLFGWAALTSAFTFMFLFLAFMDSSPDMSDFPCSLRSVARSFGFAPGAEHFDTGTGFGFLGVASAIVIAVAVSLGFGNDWRQFSPQARTVLNVALVVGVLGTTALAAATLVNLFAGLAGIIDGLLLILASWIVTSFALLIASEPTPRERLARTEENVQSLERTVEERGLPTRIRELPSRASAEWMFWGIPLGVAIAFSIFAALKTPGNLWAALLLGGLGVPGTFFLQLAWRLTASYSRKSMLEHFLTWQTRIVGILILLFVPGIVYLSGLNDVWIQRAFPILLFVLAPMIIPTVGEPIDALRRIRARATLQELEAARRDRDSAAAQVQTEAGSEA